MAMAAQDHWRWPAASLTCALGLQLLVLNSCSCTGLAASSAMSSGQRLLSFLHRNGQATANVGNVEVKPDQLVELIATGWRTNSVSKASTSNVSVVDPIDVQLEHIMDVLHDYEKRLTVVRLQAMAAYTTVQEKEKALEESFRPTKEALEKMVNAAADEAGKAEATALLNRLTRIHYEQIGALERSARYWEERVSKEKELLQMAEVKKTLEEDAKDTVEIQSRLNEANIKNVRVAEKAAIDQWLAKLDAQLRTEEAANAAGTRLTEEEQQLMDNLASQSQSLLQVNSHMQKMD